MDVLLGYRYVARQVQFQNRHRNSNGTRVVCNVTTPRRVLRESRFGCRPGMHC